MAHRPTTTSIPATVLMALLLALPATHATAQDPLPTNPTLEAAILIEEAEFDEARALERYRAIEQDTAQPAAIRRHAALRIGQLLLRSPEDQIDAAREALERASQNADDAVARAARALLEAPRPDLEREAALERQAAIRVARYRPGDLSQMVVQMDLLNDLHWIGAPGSRAILAELERAQATQDIGSTYRISELLWLTGGPQAREFLLDLLADDLQPPFDRLGALSEQLPDFARRRVASSLRFLSEHASSIFAEDLAPVAAAYAKHPEPEIFEKALAAYRLVPFDTLLEAVHSPVEGARPIAIRSLYSRLNELASNPDALEESLDAVLPVLRDAFDSVDPDVREAAGRLVGQHGPRTSLGRAFVIEHSDADALQAQFSPQSWGIEPALASREVLQLVTRIGARQTADLADGESRIFDHLAQLYAQRCTSNADLESIAALARQGFLEERLLRNWLIQHAHQGEEDVQRVLAALGDSANLAFTWLAWRDLPASAWPAIRRHVPDVEEIRRGTTWPEQAFAALASTGAPQATDYFAALIEAERTIRSSNERLYAELGYALVKLNQQRDDEASRGLIRGFLEPPFGDRKQENDAVRSACIAQLVKVGDEKLVRMLVAQPQIPQQPRFAPSPFPDWMRQRQQADWLPAGIAMLSHYIVDANGAHHWHGYTDEQLPRVWRTALQGLDPIDEDAWVAAGHLLNVQATPESSSLTAHGANNNTVPCPANPLSLPADLLTTMADLAASQVSRPDAPFHYGLQNVTLRLVIRRKLGQLEPATSEAVERLVVALLDAKDDQLRDLGVECLDHFDGDAWTTRLLDALEDPTPFVAASAIDEVAERQLPIDNERFRRALAASSAPDALMRHIAPQVEGAAAPLIAPFTRHEKWTYRLAACNALGARLEPAGVPALLTALGDAKPEVRDAARQSLEAIRFHQEQKAHWDAVFSGTAELGRSKAAARLVAQAAADQPKPKRLLAIQALGALGEPEALPFLITWTEDPDAEIAKAAQVATTRLLK